MKRYEIYKPSEIEWLGEIPEHWEVERIKDYTYLKARIGWQGLRSDEFTDNSNWYCLTGTDFSDGKINWTNCYCIDKDRYDQDKKIQLKIGDLLITKDGTIGKIALIDYLPKPTTLNSGVFVSRPRLRKYINPYMYWVLSSNVFVSFIDLNKNGTTILHLYQNVFERFYYSTPPLSEQSAIANYLNIKTTVIDRKIELLTTKADKYKALRRSLINETVCRGLNPDATLKDSGVEWIGKIPEHWEVKRFKEIANTIKGRNLDFFDTYFEKSLPNLSLEYLRNESVIFETYCYTTDRTQKATINDMIIIWDGAGVGEILKGKEGYLSSTIAKIVINQKKYNPNFFYHLRFSVEYILKMIPAGMGIPHLNPQVLNSFDCPCPPLNEQIVIGQYLDEKTTQIDTILTNINEQITKLKQLRKTLINDVVTGKLKVTE